MPAVEDLLALWETDLEFAGWDPGPIPIINSPLASTWVWSDLHLSDPGPLEAFGRPFADARAMSAQLLDAVAAAASASGRDDHQPGRRRPSGRLARRGSGRRDLRDCPGRRVLVIGNHDERELWVLAVVGFEEQCRVALTATDPPLALSHEPLRRIPPGAVNVHGHVHDGTEATLRHINLTIEQTDYAPVRLSEVVAMAGRRAWRVGRSFPAAQVSGHGPVLDSDGAGVARHHLGALPTAGLLDGGGRGAAADEFRGQPAASGVRRDAFEAGPFGEGLEAPVDLASAEPDDARAGGRRGGGPQRVDGRREPADEQPVVLARPLGVGLRGADVDPQLPGPFGGRDVLPAEGGDLRAAQARAEGQRDDRGVLEAARGGRAGRFDAAAALPALGREGQQPDGVFERERRGLARRGVRARGVLAGDAGDDGAHAGGGGWVVGAAGAVRRADGGRGHADGRRPGRLGALGQVGRDEDGGGREGLGAAGAAPGFEPGPLAGVGAPRARGAGVGRRRGDARLLAGRDAGGLLAGGGEGGIGHGLIMSHKDI